MDVFGTEANMLMQVVVQEQIPSEIGLLRRQRNGDWEDDDMMVTRLAVRSLEYSILIGFMLSCVNMRFFIRLSALLSYKSW